MKPNIIKEDINAHNLLFLWEVSRVLNNREQTAELVQSLEEIFKTFIDLNKLNIWIYDDNTDTLRDYSKNWDIISDKKRKNELSAIYKSLSNLNTEGFLLNKHMILFDKDNCIEKENAESEKNTMYLPITEKNSLIGFVEMIFDKINEKMYDRGFIISLNILASQLSTVIVNMKLTDQMDLSISFHESMKDIAKLIESQYELKYIIPLIGEMLDKFIPEHLVYIFHRGTDEHYNLIWPKKFNEKRLNPLLEKFNELQESTISKDQKAAIFPLNTEKKIFGAIAIDGNVRKLTTKEIGYIEQLTEQAAITIEKASVYAEILKHATLDALTGLNNRRQFEIRLKQEISKAKRNHSRICLMMLDIDFFKNINDTYGHLAGDCIISEVANIIKQEIRTYDTPARYGGEEFCIILPDITLKQAEKLAQRLRKKIEKSIFDISEHSTTDKKISITASIGISEFAEDETPNDLVSKSDEVLYEAKKTGRNKVVISTK